MRDKWYSQSSKIHMDHYYPHINLSSINMLSISFLWSFTNGFIVSGSARFILLWSLVIWWSTVFIPIVNVFRRRMAVKTSLAGSHTATSWLLLTTQTWCPFKQQGHRCSSVQVFWRCQQEEGHNGPRGMWGGTRIYMLFFYKEWQNQQALFSYKQISKNMPLFTFKPFRNNFLGNIVSIPGALFNIGEYIIFILCDAWVESKFIIIKKLKVLVYRGSDKQI